MSLDENAPRGKSANAAGRANTAQDDVADKVAIAAAAHITALPAPASGVALWWCKLDVPDDGLRALESVLSAGEQARAARFGTSVLRARYIVGRAALRSVLGARLGVPAAAVPILRGTRGRPCLGGRIGTEDDPAPLDFNISHTAGAAMIGVASGLRIGVDIERRDRAINTLGIARKFLSAGERAGLAALDSDTARQRVLKLWTCKEAMSKATGDALSAPFAALSVDLASRPRLSAGPAPYIPAQWTLEHAAAPLEYFATVALWRA